MKRLIAITTAILFIIAGCKQSGVTNDGVITVDVTASYPKKELILQDFMDVEYVPLETTDEFLTQGVVQDVGRNIIVVRNSGTDGDIFLFDRKTGKGLKKINRRGQGGEEYNYILDIVLDEEKGEVFVNDHSIRKILVYDPDGNFKRSFKHSEGATYNYMYSFDSENLICHDGLCTEGGTVNEQSFMIVSKHDGSITKEIYVPFEKKVLTVMISKDEPPNGIYLVSPSSYYPIVRRLDGWLIVEPSSDTIYTYTPEHIMTPFIARTPSVQSMDPEVFLLPSVISDRYYFMEIMTRGYNIETNSGLPRVPLMYDSEKKAVYRYTVYNGDYTDKRQAYLNTRPMNAEAVTWQPIQSDQLVEDYENGKLKGRLKEIASTIDEESNPVIMLIKHKK